MKAIKRFLLSGAAVLAAVLMGTGPVFASAIPVEDIRVEETQIGETQIAEPEPMLQEHSVINRTGNIESDDFSIKVACGLQGNYRAGAPVPINVNVISKKDDFSGLLRVIIPGSNYTEAVAYEKEVLFTAGEEKVVTISAYNNSSAALLTLQLENEKGKILVDEAFKFGSRLNQSALVGILSDDYTALNYFDQVFIETIQYSGESQLVELSEEDIPDTTGGLECLSYLIINSYDTSKLSKDQINTIRDWVDLGGILIIGGGSDYRQTLSGLDWIPVDSCKATEGNVAVVIRSTGILGEELEFSGNGELVVPNISGGNPVADIVSEKDLVSNLDFGEGHVVFTGFNLGMEPVISNENRSQLAANILICSATGNSAYRLSNLNYGNSDDIWQVRGILNRVTGSKSPNMIVIIIVMGLFVIAGPVLYFVLKKNDKRELLWGIIPLMAVAATFIIFLANINIRIKYPVATSFTIIDDQSEEEDQSITARIDMSVTIPGTDRESVTTDKSLHNLQMIMDYRDWSYGDNTSLHNNYATAIRQTAEGYRISFKNEETFQNKYFTFDAPVAEEKISLETDYKRTINGLSGTVTNNTGYEYAGGGIFVYGKFVPLGPLKSGESYTFTEDENMLSYDGDIWNAQFPGISNDSQEYDQLINICQNLYQSNMAMDMNMDQTAVYTVCFFKEWSADYISDNRVKEYNCAAYMKKTHVDLDDYKDAFITNLFNYADYTDAIDVNDGQLYKIPADVTFQMRGVEVKALIRNSDDFRRYGYTGNTAIFIWNNVKNNFEEIFIDGLIQEFSDMTPYVNDMGEIQMRFDAQTPYEDYAPGIVVVGGER